MVLKHALFVCGVAFHGFYQAGYQVVSPFELNLDIRPRGFRSHPHSARLLYIPIRVTPASAAGTATAMSVIAFSRNGPERRLSQSKLRAASRWPRVIGIWYFRHAVLNHRHCDSSK